MRLGVSTVTHRRRIDTLRVTYSLLRVLYNRVRVKVVKVFF